MAMNPTIMVVIVLAMVVSAKSVREELDPQEKVEFGTPRKKFENVRLMKRRVREVLDPQEKVEFSTLRNVENEKLMKKQKRLEAIERWLRRLEANAISKMKVMKMLMKRLEAAEDRLKQIEVSNL